MLLVSVGFLLVSLGSSAVWSFPAGGWNPLNATISPLLTHDVRSNAGSRVGLGGLIGPNPKTRVCKCSEVALCQKLGRAEVAFCTRRCAVHLQAFGKNQTEMAACFQETLQELEIWNNCLRMGVPNFCNKQEAEEEATSTQQFDYPLGSTYVEFLQSAGSSTVKRSRRAYVQMRSYQHCFNSCAKRAESQCLLSNGCRPLYPPPAEVHRLMDECDGLFPKALHSAVNTCECLVREKKCVKLTDVCEMIGNRFLMTVL